MHIGLFFGSYNPIHLGHLIIAESLVNETPLEEIWLMVTPQSPFKAKKNLLEENARYDLVERATADNPHLRASNFEFGLPRPSYTIDTLTELVKAYPAHEFALIMGADNLSTLHKWKKGDVILANYPIYVYPRRGSEPELPLGGNVTLTDAPILEISATRIRRLIRSGLSTRYILPEPVREEIDKWGYYQD
jgi:nicotinate-nucleotide adenylyltransferase